MRTMHRAAAGRGPEQYRAVELQDGRRLDPPHPRPPGGRGS